MKKNISLLLTPLALLAIVCMSQALPRSDSHHPNIVGGEEVAPGEIPFQVALLYNGRLTCGGSILNEEWIVTAAHCADNSVSPDPYSVRVGVHNIVTPEAESQVRKVVLKIIHEDFLGSGSGGSDIAIMKLESPLVLNDLTRAAPIQLAPPGTEVSGQLRVSGWGTTSSGGYTADKLRAVSVPFVDDGSCIEAYGSVIKDSMICAGLQEGGKDSCQGDSGGPLTSVINGSVTLVGIVSWGYGCASPNYPGVYTEVSYFQPWVLAKIAANP